MFRFTIRDMLWLMVGTFAAWLVTGWFYMGAVDGAELHPDAGFMRSVCLIAPLVGFLLVLLSRRIGRPT